MKRVLLSVVAAGTLLQADFIGASVGVGAWKNEIDGYVKVGDSMNYLNKTSAESDGDINTGNLGLKSDTKPYIWAKIFHPVPVIPNIKATYMQYSASGSGNASGSVEMFGKSFDVTGDIKSDITINALDVTLFYQFKPVFVSIEAGFGVNLWKGKTKLVTDLETEEVDWTLPLPYLYASAESMKVMGFNAEATVKYIKAGDNHYKDLDGGVRFHLPFPILDLSGKLGYKLQDIKGVDGNNETNIKYKGVYIEAGVKW